MKFNLDKPNIDDGKEMWRIARDTGVLDLNSPYAYLLAGTHFKNSSVIAKTESGVAAGYVYGYTIPDSPEHLFVWQIGVHRDFQGKGLAMAMLTHLATRPECNNITHIDATIAPENTASNALFGKLGSILNTSVSNDPYFNSTHFPSGNQIENYISVGPLNKLNKEEIK